MAFMRLSLSPHPDTPSQAVSSIEVVIERPRPGSVALTYIATGRIAEVAIPPTAPAQRADELWRHTCFEAFLRGREGEGYYEFNLSPSTEWAAYSFNGYRSGMRPAPMIAPRIEAGGDKRRFGLQAVLRLADTPWRLGLAAVIEEKDGRVSYWALAHPPGKPDFHHADCFAAELAAPQRP
jgi:hypothetical protein